MTVEQKMRDGMESLKNEIRYVGEREKLITLFVIGFVFYQYIPFSAVAGYLLGGLVTTIFYLVVISAAIIAHIYGTYNINPIMIFHFWTALEEEKKMDRQKEVDDLKKEADARVKFILPTAIVVKAINENENEDEDEIKKCEEDEIKKEADARVKAINENENEIKKCEEDEIKKEVDEIKYEEILKILKI